MRGVVIASALSAVFVVIAAGTVLGSGSPASEPRATTIQDYQDGLLHHIQRLQGDFHGLGHFLLRPLSINGDFDDEWRAEVYRYADRIVEDSNALLDLEPPAPEFEAGHERLGAAAQGFLDAMHLLTEGLDADDAVKIREAASLVAESAMQLDEATQGVPGFHHH